MPKDRLYATTRRERALEYSRNTSRSTNLPPQVLRSVPQCAQQCLAGYINQRFNCASEDFSCLCDHDGLGGYTLGEVAYICVATDCDGASKEVGQAAYGVCDSDAQAVQPTHDTLTVPGAISTSRHASATTSTRTAAGFTTTHQTTRETTQPETTLQTKSSTSPVTTNTALSTAAGAGTQSRDPSASAAAETSRASSTSNNTSSLTPAQAAGVSIGAFGAIILVVGLVYFIACFRRRKSKRTAEQKTHKDERKDYDFIDEAPPRISPFNHGHADPRGPLGGFHKPRAELMADKRATQWPRQSQFGGPVRNQRHEKDTDMSPATYQSNDSKRSQLLPDKPYSTLLKPFQRSSALTTTTIFEEDRPKEQIPPVPKITLPKIPPAGTAIYHPPPPQAKTRNAPPAQQYPSLPVNPRDLPPSHQYPSSLANPRKAPVPPQNPRSPEKPRQPPLSLDIPKQAARLPRIPSPVAFPLPPTLASPAQIKRDGSADSRSRSRESIEGSLLNYYASPDAGYDTSPDIESPTTPIDDVIQRRKAAPNTITITKPTMPPRAIRVNSTGSDTSFESNASNDATPPEEVDKQLTPVQESDSPISGIKYPKIPRSSNQAVARSPAQKLSPGPTLSPLRIKKVDVYAKDRADRQRQQQVQQQRQHTQPDPATPQRNGTNSSTLSGSTLAAKRIGNSAAQDLERRLYIDNSSHSRANSNATSKGPKSEPNSGKSLQHPAERKNTAESPLKGYGRVASGGRRVSRGQIGPEMKSPGPQLYRSPGFPGEPQEVTMKSPLWEPKLTPSRKGDDLYLSVGMASPMTAAFTPFHDNFAH